MFALGESNRRGNAFYVSSRRDTATRYLGDVVTLVMYSCGERLKLGRSEVSAPPEL